MCARRFLILVLVLSLLTVAGAFAIFQFGQDILIRNSVPSGRFEAPPASEGPDYAQQDAWLARPDMEGPNPSAWLPEGYPPPVLLPKSASVFYVLPTTYLKKDRWNAPLAGDSDSDERATLFVRSQASAFNDKARVWVPRYRQAAFGAFLLASDDSSKALDFAYADVRRAFETFLARTPESDRIILAGHSQGSLHLLRLLRDFGPQLKNRLVAAYVVGWPVSPVADLEGIAMCEGPRSTGCVMSWQSFAEPANPSLMVEAWENSPGPFAAHRRRDIACTNPVSGTLGGSATASDNPGTLVPEGDLSNAKVEAGLVGARCDGGILLIDGDIPAMGPYVLPGNNYHVYDYALFWGAVRRDAGRRLAATPALR